MHSVGGVRVASGRDFDESTGKIAEGKNVLLLNEAEASDAARPAAGRAVGGDEGGGAGYAAFARAAVHDEHLAAGGEPQAGS